MSRSEGKQIFNILFLVQCLLGYLLNIAESILPISFQVIKGVSLLNIIIVIWNDYVRYLVIKERYHFYSGQSIRKLILIEVVGVGLPLVCIYLFAVLVY